MAAALVTFAEVGRVFDRVTRERIPTTLAALDLSRHAERIASLAPRLVADETMVAQLRTDRIIRGHIVRLEGLLAHVKAGRSDPFFVAEIEISSGDESVLESHRREVAVLFCDLRGFTAGRAR